MAVPTAVWVGLVHPEITPTSNFHQLRDTTDVLSGVNTVTIVCEMNLPSIKHTMDLLETIRELPGAKKPVTVLINKRKRSLFGGDRIPKAKLKQLFGDTPFDFLPDEHDLMAEAMDRGVTLSDVNSSSKFLKAVTKYATSTLLAEKAVSA